MKGDEWRGEEREGRGEEREWRGEERRVDEILESLIHSLLNK